MTYMNVYITAAGERVLEKTNVEDIGTRKVCKYKTTIMMIKRPLKDKDLRGG